MAGTRNRLGELSAANLPNDTSQNFGMQPIGPSPPYSTAWGNNVWSSPIGSGIKSSPDANRAPGKPAPLSKTAASTMEQGGAVHVSPMDGSEKLSGPSSLLSSSESEGWNGRRHWPSMSGISAGLNTARNGNADTSPVRQRANQQTRSSSPFFSQQSTVGSGATNKSGQSLLDPTSRSFNSSGLFNSHQQPPSHNHDYDDANRSNLTTNYDSVASNSLIPSGYNSNGPSRSGSLPPSRHGNDYSAPFGDYTTSSVHTNMPDAFGQRANQHSRNSTISTNGPGRFSDTPWQSNVGDLTALMGRMNTGRDALEESLSSLWGDQSSQLQSPNRVFGAMSAGFNGPPNGEFFTNQRSNSISYDADGRMFPSVAPSFNHQRIPFPDRSSNSPTGSDARRSRGSPQYFNANTPPLLDHTRGVSNASGRSNLNPHNLDRKLEGLQDQQSYAPSPVIPFRPSYLGAYDVNAQSTQRINQQLQYYQSSLGVGLPYGAQQPPFNIPHQPPRSHQPGQMLREPPRGPAGDNVGDSLRSSLLEEFRATKGTRKYDLKDIYNHVVEFSGDQHGSRFIQQKLETANSDEKAQLFAEILPNALQLMTDVFGNYVIQKFFEHGNQTQKKQLADKLRGHIAEFSLQMYGCRVVQKAFEHILTDQQASLVKELESQVLKCVKDQNGNHVIQKAIQRIPAENISFIINAFTNQVQHLATHPYGCRVVQRMLEHCQDPVKTNILEELHQCAEHLIVDQYGNYVTQHVIVHGRLEDRLKIISIITSQLVMYSRHKFASNVVEKSIEYGTDEQRRRIVEIISAVDERGIGPMQELIKDQYGNYVIQKLLKLLQGPEHEAFISSLKPQIARIKQFSYAKQIGQIERLVSLGPAPTLTDPQPNNFSSTHHIHHHAQVGASSDNNHQHPNPPVDFSVAPTPPLVSEDAQSPPSSSQPSTNNSTVDGPIGRKEDGARLRVEDADADAAETMATSSKADEQ